MNMNNLFTDQNFLIAKAICTNQSKSTSDLALFNKLFRELIKKISSDYSIVNDVDGYSTNAKYKIYMPAEKLDEGEGNSKTPKREASIGTFILETLKNWDPEKSKYLTYIKRLLESYGYRYPMWMTDDQIKYESQITKTLIPLLKEKTGKKQISRSDISKYIREYLPDYPIEKLLLIESINSQNLELDKTFNEDEETSFLDMTEDISEKPNLSHFDNLENLIAQLYSTFKREQKRTQVILSIYITVNVFSSLLDTNDIEEFDKLSKSYPDMIDNSYFPWIKEFYENKRKENESKSPDSYNKATLFPSRNDQAEKIGKEYYSYSMVISRFIKKLKNSIKDPFFNNLY